jgi:amino acid adenylation domain-containing protein
MSTELVGFPLSQQQQRLWQLQQRGGALRAWCAVRVRGTLGAAALRERLEAQVARHDIFRTTFHAVPGQEVLQVVADQGAARWRELDLRGLTPQAQHERLEEAFAEEERAPYEARRDAPLRATLAHLSETERVLVLGLPSLCGDAGTLRNLVAALAAGGEPDEEPVQYAQFADWQRELLEEQSEEARGARAHWRRQEETPQPRLPLEREAPEGPFQPGTVAVALDARLEAGVAGLARRHGVTPESVLLACWSLLLWRLSGQGELAVAVGLEGRTLEDLRDALGPFARAVPVRLRLDGRRPPRFPALLAQVGESLKTAERWQDHAGALETPVPAWQFELHAPWEPGAKGGVTLSLLRLRCHAEPFRLKLSVLRREDGLVAELHHDPRRLAPEAVRQLAEGLVAVVESVVREPGLPVDAVEVLGEAMRRQVLREWSGANTLASEETGEPVHVLVARRAAETPEQPAVEGGGEVLTWGELETRAHQLARRLRALGAGPDTVVGLCLERSPRLAVGVLGILKAGAAWLPLDPSYPPERLAFMLEDARAGWLVAEERTTGLLPGELARVLLDGDAGATPAGELPEPVSQPGSLAYVIYTSGSTGRPKGVALTHAGLGHYVRELGARLGLTAGDVYVHTASISFSSSVRQLLTPLVAGARVLLATSDEVRDPVRLLERVAERGGTVLDLVPSYWRTVVQALSEASEPMRARLPGARLRLLVSASEPLPADLPRAWTQVTGHPARLVNMAGQTETTGIVSLQPLEDVRELAGTVPVGRSLPGLEQYVLDERLRAVPPGVDGELYIGGPTLARGYLGKAELTAERFVPHPFATRPGARLYRTGDLARWRPDGTLELRGRADEQVKIRGMRVEPGEVEQVLRRHAAVRECVVVAREDVPGERRLVAYVVTRAPAPETEELRTFARDALPAYLVPAAVVTLEALPRTPTGKVDRRALPVPEQAVARAWEAPRTPTEKTLAAIWCEVLRRERVGAGDHFFRTGGHSLLAMQVVARMQRSFERDIPVRALFEHPVLRELAHYVDALPASSGHGVPPLVRVPRGEALTASYAQERLWLLDRLEPGSPRYNIPAAVRLTGPLDGSALRRSLEELLRRHEALRTTFAEVEGRPVQHFLSGVELPFREVDLSGLPASEREAALRREVLREAQASFELSRGPLVRAALWRLGAAEHVAVLTMHHIVSDGWSIGVLVRELAALYESFCAGRPSPLAELSVQYADFAVWQRGWLTGEVLERQLTWWQERLAGTPALELPTDHPRPPVQTSRGARYTFTLPGALGRELEALARREGVTPFMVLMAGFQVLLARYSGQDDLAVGTPIANRSRRELEGLVGFFVNTLVLRARLSGAPHGRELLQRVREMALGAYAHQDVPFEKLVERLAPERDLSRTPLFQAMFVLQNVPAQALRLPGLTLQPLETDTGATRFDLTLTMAESEGTLAGSFEYNADLFEAGTVARMAGHFTRLLEGLTAHPERPIHLLPLLSSEEHQALLVDINRSGAPAPFVPVHQRFLTLARQRPDAPALVSGQQPVTYGELASRSLALASVLRRHGVGPESLVGLFLEREPSCVVSILAVLHCGAAFLPLDTASPPQRLSLMVAQAAPRLVVTTPELASRLPEGLQTVWAHEAGEAVSPVDVAPESLAYAIFTSGSTGTPKAVLLSHSGLCNLAQAQVSGFGLTANSRTLQFASLSFDAAVSEIFTALTSGGCLVFAPREALLGDALLHTLREQRVTTVTLPPAVLSLLSPEGLEDLRTVVSAGESCAPQVLARWASGRTLLNAYGPTESTVCATMSEAPVLASGHVSLGRPLPGIQVYVLDAHLQPVPTGVTGELFLSGAGLARGYLGLPSLTAERFLPHPFSTTPGARLYRTGDAARFLSDGSLEYLGRLDSQVKLRGFRIELGEVESALLQHPSVHSAVALVREDSPGDKRLVAYLVPHSGQSLEAHALRAFLQQRLPEYMVPAAFVSLSALPLSSNGKVDKKALPVPEAPASTNTYVAPRTPTEERLASLWAQVLRVERVGLHDDFFALGGHSLLATQLISRVRASFGIELPVRSFFEAPTVSALARRIQQASLASAPPLRLASRTGPLPLSFAQQRLWFLNQLEPTSAAYNIPFALRLTGPLNSGALRRSLDEIVRRHEALRTTFAESDGRPVQVIPPHRPLELREVDLSRLPASERDAELQRHLQHEAQAPFELSRGLMLRASLLRLAPEEHVALVTVHHIASDGWSIGVLVRELAALYEAFCAGRPSPLPELPVQYADFAAWQREWLSGENLAAQLGWWKQQLQGAPAALELPTDRPRPAVQSSRGAKCAYALPGPIAAGLGELSRREGVTLFMTLLAAFQTLLHRYSGSQDVVVGTPIANRTHAETEGLIGFFVNTLALRARFDGAPSFRTLLQRVREASLGAYAHQDLPFERLVEELAPQRSLGRTPLFQVLFVLQNTPTGQLQPAGLTLSPLETHGGTARFDLTLSLAETEAGLEGSLEYSTDLFDESTVRRMLGHFSQLLASIVAHPDWPVSRLPLLPEDELRQLLVSGPGAQRPSTSFLRLVHQRAALHPEALAVVSEGESLTYAQLTQRAHPLAWHLRSLGVSQDSVVALCLERSSDMAVALLATLEAGAAYLPLDPTYPQQRLDFMLQDSGASLVLSQRHLAASLPSSARVLLMEELGDTLSGAPSTAPVEDPPADSLAYVIYTSGSTGTPKGVAMRHGALAHLIHWQLERSPLPSATTLQFAPLSFDVSFQECFSTWASGGTLVLAPPALRREPAALLRFLAAHRVQRLFLPFVALQQLSQAAHEVEVLPPLVEVITAGEQLQVTPALVSFFQRMPGCVLDNQYGPSETHVVSAFQLSGNPSRWPALPPIGQPLPGTQLLVLDAHLQPCPVGVPGELFLGGTALSRGYLGRPALSAERFIPHPFASEPGARLYRTGDAARLLPDGNVEFLGRLDSQVKLRGFRIELGEVEAALQQHPLVHQAAASIREDSPGDRRLVAYVVPAQGQTPDAAALRSFLLQRLPDYMVPAAFVSLPSFPLTPSGKVEKKALPTPDSGALARTPSRPPQSQTEVTLASLWSQLLGLSSLGAQDDFFALGGHSLLATQLASRIRSTFHVELPLRALFEAPTLEALAARIDALSAAPRPAQLPPPTPVSRSGPLPLSFSQQRLWFLHQLEPQSPAYNLPFALRLTGGLDTEALQRSLDELLRRHESLRTTFTSHEGRPVQVIAPSLRLPLALADLSSLPASEREQAISQRLSEEARKPFDVARGPLLRAALLKLGPEEHIGLFTLHHLVSDGWSIGVLVRELAALYGAFHTGQPSPLPEPAIQYADFASWQREHLAGPVLTAQLDWWKQQLTPLPEPLRLPTDRQRPPVQTSRGRRVPFLLAPELATRLESLAQREGATLFMVLQAALDVLLYRHGAGTDISVGTPIANRTRAEFEPLIGLFINTLVMRVNVSGQPTFRELLGRVREVALGAYAHQDVPFDKLVEELTPTRDPSRTPLFQVMLVLQNAPLRPLELPGLRLQPLEMETGAASFELTFTFTPTESGLGGSLEYNSDLFHPGTAASLVEHLRTLLEGIVARPETPISRLPLMTAGEQSRLLREWSRGAPLPTNLPLAHERIEAHAARTPSALAVISEQGPLTYGELDARARRLAARLRALGVGPDTFVGVAVERSLEMVVGVLGVLEVGGAYVPLDPRLPPERLALIVEDARPRVVLATRRQAELFGSGTPLVYLDDPELRTGPIPARAPPPPPESTAYVIYTSGSTGRPKGTLIPHGSLAAYVEAMCTAYGFTAEDRVLQTASLGFDTSVEEIFCTLASGARLYLRTEEMTGSVAELFRRTEEWGLTVLDLPTSLWHEVVLALDVTGAKLPASVRQVIIGGERAAPERVARWLARVSPKTQLINAYGPTEATVSATLRDLTRQPPEEGVTEVPIGQPIPGAEAYVLDEHLEPVPPRVPGELYLGGALARGYLSQPALTAERFIPNPFATTPGARLYRTGDLVRLLPDGHLEYLGRVDRQLKVQGYRVEPEEVEATLQRHPAVRACAVVVREDAAGTRRLVGYWSPVEALETEPDLKALLAGQLPAYMVPSVLVRLERMPLNASGKVDRSALPRVELQATEAVEHTHVPPRDAVELRLARLWEEVLGRPVGATDDFFALGGHSLLLLRLSARVQAVFGRELPLASFFRHPTLEQLAAVLRQDSSESASPLVPLRAQGRRRPLFCVHPVGGTVACYAELARRLEDRPLYALQAIGLEGEHPPLTRVEDMARAYVAAMREVQPSGPYLLAGWSVGGVLAFEMARQLTEAGETVARVLLLDARAPAWEDPGGGEDPLARARAQAGETGDDSALLAAFLREAVGPLPEAADALLRSLPPAGRLTHLLEQARSRHLLPPDVGVPQLRRVFHVFQATSDAVGAYRPGPWSGELTLLRATGSRPAGGGDATYGWGALSTRPVAVHDVTGHHRTFMESPEVEGVARALETLLEEKGGNA